MSIKAIIIDDVADARTNLKVDLETYCPQIKVIGEAEGVVSGAKILRESNPDVVFLDIQMQDGSGFDLLEILPEINFQLIFTTSSDAHAIRAFRFSAIDYLLKPIDPDLLVEAVDKLSGHDDSQQVRVNTLLENIQSKKPITRLALATQEKVHVVKIADIVRCESKANYTIFYLNSGRQMLVTRTLKEFDSMLKEHQFIRTHQSHLVNAHYIKEFVKSDGGYLVMTDGANVLVSSRRRSHLIQALNEI